MNFFDPVKFNYCEARRSGTQQLNPACSIFSKYTLCHMLVERRSGSSGGIRAELRVPTELEYTESVTECDTMHIAVLDSSSQIAQSSCVSKMT